MGRRASAPAIDEIEQAAERAIAFDPSPNAYQSLAESCVAFAEEHRVRALEDPIERPPPGMKPM